MLHNTGTGHDMSESDNKDDSQKIKDEHKPKKCKTDPDSDNNLDPAQSVTKAYENNLDFKELLDVYNSTKPKALANLLTDPIPEPLTKIPESWFWGHYSSTEIKAEQVKTKCPANATALIPVQINEELYHSISPDGKFLDRPFRYIQNPLGKGAQPLVSVWYKIIQCQSALKKQNPDKSAILTVGPNLEVDFAELRELLDLSLHFFGMASFQLVIQRRLDLGSFVTPGF